MVFDFDNITD